VGGSINPAATLDSSGIATDITAGTFTINGVQFNVDASTDSLQDVLDDINASAAGITATYDAGSDKVVFENTDAADTAQIVFGASGDTSNLLSALAVTQATQATNGNGSTTVQSTRHLGAIDPTGVMDDVNFANGAITAGTFSINGISISVDPTSDTIIDVIERINGSDAQVTASFDTASDTIRFVSDNLGSRTIRFGGASDTSNFLNITNLSSATQTAGKDAEFTVNGGAVQTRNTNEISDAIGGVTIRLLSTGESTVSVSYDDDAIVEDVREFVDAFNASINQIDSLTRTGGTLAGDSGIRAIQDFLRQNIFAQVPGLNGDYDSLLNIGIDTGSDFNSTALAQLQFDEEEFRAALLENRANVEQLFTNANGTGIADKLYDYLNETTSTTGFLNNRSKDGGAIGSQIDSINDQISRIQDRLGQKEERLRRQFNRLESLSAGLQQQNSALSALGRGLRLF
jgi:flagellar hook-associated protein 2